MLGETIHLRRAVFTTSKSVQGLIDQGIGESFIEQKKAARCDYRLSAELVSAIVLQFGAGSTGKSPYVELELMGAIVTFKLNTGVGEKRVKHFVIEESDLERLRKHAKEAFKFKVDPKPVNMNPKKRGSRRPKPPPEEQESLF